MKFDRIRDVLDDALKNHSTPCSDVIISLDNKIVYRYMNGTKDDNGLIPISGDELYFLYSASKPITCVAALQLYEQRKLGLDDYLYQYIPEYEHIKVKTENGELPVKNHIRLRHLFTMTSGMDYDLKHISIKNQLEKNRNSTTLDIVRAMAEKPLEFEPGEHYMYGLSHDVLAAVVEVVSGMSFGEYLQKNIFDVCGMKNTYVGFTQNLKEKLCSQYRYDEALKTSILINKENEFILSPIYQSGGAGIVSCTEDYIRFAQELVNGEKLLKRETINLMRQGHLAGETCHDFHELKPDYSYGLGVRTNVDGRFSAIGEFGWDGAAGAYGLFDPDHHLAIFYVTHVRDYGDYLCNELHPRIRDIVYEDINENSFVA